MLQFIKQMLNNFKLSQYECSQSSPKVETQIIGSAQSQSYYEEYRLLKYQISDKFRFIERLLHDRTYWNVFWAFKKITNMLQPYELRRIRLHQLKKIVIKHLECNKRKKETLRFVFKQFRYNIKIEDNWDQKIIKAAYIIIKEGYKQIAKCFCMLKKNNKKQSFMEMMARNKQIEEKQITNQDKIIRIKYQNKKLTQICAAKQIKNTLQTIILRLSYMISWQKLARFTSQSYQKGHVELSTFQKQKAKFAKKQTQANQVQVLSKIILKGIEVQSIQKDKYDFIKSLNSYIIRQIVKRQKEFFMRIKEKYASNIGQQKKVATTTSNLDNSYEENDSIYTNVLSNLCYVSKKIYVKFVQKIPQKMFAQQKLGKIVTMLQRKDTEHMAFGFGCIKIQNFNYLMSLRHRIQQLQQIKQKYYEYFNQTQHEQQQQAKELNF